MLLCAIVCGARYAWAQDSWDVSCNTDCDGVNTCMENRLCDGYMEEEGACSDNPECAVQDDRCPPVDCQWQEWTQWSNDGVSGLCARQRDFRANRCGGAPCIGVASETMYCDPENQLGSVQDCEFSAWSDWSACDSATLQRVQKRVIARPPSSGGRSCDGPLSTTEPCGVRMEPVDCELSLWMHWSGCSEPCGGGQHTRLRTIQHQSRYGGKLCGDTDTADSSVLMETKACNVWACGGDEQPQDCALGDWGEWGACENSQRFRERQVAMPAAHGGKSCERSLKEVTPCQDEVSTVVKVDCALTDWTPWTLCSKTCLGGQTTRERSISVHADNGGEPCEEVTSETMPCNDFPCSVGAESKDCVLAQWTPWGKCSSDCGDGAQTRTRTILILASEGGVACSDPVEEMRPCEDLPACEIDDCKWSGWSRWSPCSQSCGGGHRARNRTVSQQPSSSGAACEALDSISEMQSCNTIPCYNECVDGLWGSWSEWGSCSVSCDQGASWRQRTVAITASACGEPAEGDATEVRICNQKECEADVDCQLGEWSAWAACSASCDGVTYRERAIEAEAAGYGSQCSQTVLQETAACNTAKDFLEVNVNDSDAKAKACGFAGRVPVDCRMADWLEWSPCSVTCDGGQRSRERKFAMLAQFGGKACEEGLRETAPCDAVPCVASEDCQWEQWEDWASCNKCDGERMRQRAVVSHAKGRGKACAAGDSQELQRCDECPPTKLFHCVWGDYATGECSVSCGTNGWRKKVRQLEGLTSVPEEKRDLVVGSVSGDYARCEGSEVDYVKCEDSIQACDYTNCEPVDCKLSDWLQWEQPLKCEGLCSRSRFILSKASCGGTPCNGSLTETKACPSENCKVDKPCQFGEWSAWTECQAGSTQRTRERSVEVPGGPQGAACEGNTQETQPCEEGSAEEAADCAFGEWGEYGPCSRSCGGGSQEKSREVATHAVGGGKACTGVLKVTRPCGEVSCSGPGEDCIFGLWMDWAGCKEDGGSSSQATRTRSVKVARGDGLPCSGAVTEVGPCGSTDAVDCTWSTWSNWGACSEECGGGQHFRFRDILASPRNGGAMCNGDMEDTDSCNEFPCSPVDCQTSEWTTWSDCNANCGQGQQTRQRQVVKAGQQGGDGCTTDLEESRGCTAEGGGCDGDRDCAWGFWSTWSDCFKAEMCGIGYRRRVRAVEEQAQGAGKPCVPASVEEVAASSTCPGSCDARSCVDGKWGDWGAWEQCSVTCGQGGVQMRARVVKEEANDCGRPAEGDSREFRSCGSQAKCDVGGPVVRQDCVFSEWTAWEPPVCPAKCNGDQQRSRTIVRYSANGGLPCEGPTSEVTGCNPGPGEDDPEGCESGSPVDCVMEQWSGFSKCSAACGTGHMVRLRQIAQKPRLGGLACEPSLVEIKECNASQPCVDWSVDCKLADWGEWSACDDMTGQMTRSRDVGEVKVGFGQDCEGTRYETQDCRRQCQDQKYSCGWAAWSTWSQCSTTCGPEGRRARVRNLQLSSSGTAAAAAGGLPRADLNMLLQKEEMLVTKYSELSARLSGATSKRSRDLILAFGGGAVAFVSLLGLLRLPLGRSGRLGIEPANAFSSLHSPLSSRRDAGYPLTPGHAAADQA